MTGAGVEVTMLRWGGGPTAVRSRTGTADRRSPPYVERRPLPMAPDRPGGPVRRDDDTTVMGYSPLAEEYGGTRHAVATTSAARSTAAHGPVSADAPGACAIVGAHGDEEPAQAPQHQRRRARQHPAAEGLRRRGRVQDRRGAAARADRPRRRGQGDRGRAPRRRAEPRGHDRRRHRPGHRGVHRTRASSPGSSWVGGLRVEGVGRLERNRLVCSTPPTRSCPTTAHPAVSRRGCGGPRPRTRR